MKMKVLFTLITLWLCLGGVKVYAQTYIGTEAELRAFATAVNNGTFGTGTAYLIADINLTGSWTPIGNATNQFKGQFEGWGHTISNLNVTGSNDYAGLFGYIDGGSVRDVGIASGGVSGKSCVGGICGYLKAGEISSCYNKTTVSGEDYVGGLCGKSKGTIKNCWHTGNVTATAETSVCAGGLVGCCESGADLLRCYVIVTSISVPDATGENSLFGQVVGEWKGPINVDKLNSCVFNKTDVIVVGFEATDVVFGSYNGSASVKPEAVSVKGATEQEMLSKTFWSTRLNVGIESVMEETLFNQIWVLPLQYGSNDLLEVYPQLNSFENQYGDKKYGSKNKTITFNFTESKQWLTIVPNGNYNVPNDVEAYKVTRIEGSTTDGGTVYLSSVGKLYEGCPTIVYSAAGTPKETVGTISGLNSEGYSAWQGNNLLQGSPTSPDHIASADDYTAYQSGKDVPDDTYYVLSNGAFVIAGPGTIARGKAYLKIRTEYTYGGSSSGGKFRLVFQNEEEKPTNILSVDNSQLSDDNWYTLDGRKLEGEHTEKGVYIVNGKKVMVQ
jgi:hypothetical protein